mgnify:CR=1 FL=1
MSRELADQLDAELEQRARELGLSLEPTPAADLIVQTEISQPAAGSQLHVIQSFAVIAGEVAVRGEVQSCVECSAAALLERGLELLPDAAEALRAAKRDAEREAAQAREAAERAAQAPAPTVEPQREQLRRTLGYVGASVSVLGLASTIAGAVLLAREVDYDRTYVNLIDYGPPGWTLTGVGLAAMVAGNVLLALDLGRPPSRRMGSIGVAPQLSAAPGLLVRGRF